MIVILTDARLDEEADLARVHRRPHRDPQPVVEVVLLLEQVHVLESSEHRIIRQHQALPVLDEPRPQPEEALILEVLEVCLAVASILRLVRVFVYQIEVLSGLEVGDGDGLEAGGFLTVLGRVELDVHE